MLHKVLLAGVSLAVANSTFAQSLQDAVNTQLSADPFPCEELRAGNDIPGRFTGALDTICGAVVPAGSGASSGGGNSATPIAAPSAMTEFVDDAHNGTTEGVSIARDWNLFFTIEGERFEQDNTDFLEGYDSDKRLFIAGLGYRASDRTVFGLSVNVGQEDGDFDLGGSLDQDSIGVRLLGSFRPSEKTSILVVAGMDSISTEQDRNASISFNLNGGSFFYQEGVASSDYDQDQYGLSVLVTREYQHGKFTFMPELGLSWERTDYDTYSETGNYVLDLTYYDNERTSLQRTLGLTTTAAYSTSFGSVVPQLGIKWFHEFDDDQRDVFVSFVCDTLSERFSYQTTTPDRNFFHIDAGVVFVLTNGVQAFANVRTLAGHDYYDSVAGSLGFRIEL